MNKKIVALLIAGIVCVPLTSVANSDDSKYPAANFQPKVIFADESATSTSANTESSTFDPDYPAANFQPKVLYVDASALSTATSAAKGETSTFDPKYPAANFEPKVIFP
jgi:L-fucose mutarotase/ribose pyranase (RbsD/FucU family)